MSKKNWKSWTQEEIDSLKKGIIPINRSKFSIQNMRQKLGLVYYKASRWTTEHKKQLFQLVKQGKNQKEISEILPYSQKGIQKQILKMNLQKTRQYKFTQKELDKFKKFLLENWKQKTPNELVILWNQNNKKVGKNKIVYHLRKLGIKIPKDESLRMNFLRRKEQKIYSDGFYKTTKEAETKIREIRIELMKIQ